MTNRESDQLSAAELFPISQAHIANQKEDLRTKQMGDPANTDQKDASESQTQASGSRLEKSILARKRYELIPDTTETEPSSESYTLAFTYKSPIGRPPSYPKEKVIITHRVRSFVKQETKDLYPHRDYYKGKKPFKP